MTQESRERLAGQLLRDLENPKKIDWPGASGEVYAHWIYTIGHKFEDEPGGYVFAKETQPGRWKPLYIGTTKSLGERFDGHHKVQRAINNGATHVHAMRCENKQERLRIESDLVAKWNPPCND